MAIVYGLKVNLSVAMVAMLNHTAISRASGSPEHDVHMTSLANVTASSIVSDGCGSGTESSSVVEVILY